MKRLNPDIGSISIRSEDTLRKAIAVIDDNPAYGMALVTDSMGRLVGILTTGDVYKSIFSGVNLDVPCGGCCNPHPLTLKEDELKNPSVVRERIEQLLERKGLRLPILDSHSRVVDVVHFKDVEDVLLESIPHVATRERILVVGGAGYLGTTLCRLLLRRGYAVRVLDSFVHGNFSLYKISRQSNLEIVQGDVRDIRNVVDALEDVYAVMLLSAVVGDPAGKSNPKATVEINYLAAKMVAEAARYAHVRRLLFASTCSVYGTGARILDEEAAVKPVSHYARTKIAAEEAILSLGNGDFSPTILRMGTLYGLSPRMRFDLVVNLFSLRAIRFGAVEVLGGKQWRPLLHVKDAARAFVGVLEALHDKIAGQVFNVGAEEQNYQVKDLADIVRSALPETRIAVKSGTEDARDYRVSFEKIRTMLGFKTTRTVFQAVREIGRFVARSPKEDFENSKYTNNSVEY